MPARGRLIALEGIDGCGKSTQANALAGALGARLTHEPGATPVGGLLRQLLLAPDSPPPSARTEALLMAADRAEHVTRVLEPALAAGEWVVTDRYSASTIAYQGYGRGLDPVGLSSLVSWAAGGLAADLSVLVDVSVEVAAARLAASGGLGADRMEQLGPQFASRVRQGFLAQAAQDPEHWLVVDGTGDVAALTARIVASVRERLGGRAGGAPVSEERPAPELFAGVVGQAEAVAALRAAAVNPVHAYLFRGAAGNGGLAAAHGFAAALLCQDGGCGVCATCRAALAGTDPDLHVIRRSGASISIAEIRQVVSLAQRRPLHAARQVIVLLDVHLAALRAPALLKTLEEPPGETVFILLTDEVIPELVTVASRSVEIEFPPVPREVLVRWLTDSGVPSDTAAVVADSSGGNPERARITVDDPDVAARVALWASVPDELGPSGMTAAGLTRRVLESADRSVEPLRAAHAREIETLTAAARDMGERGLPGRKEIAEQFQREERRFRTDALRAGLGVLARAYRSKVSAAAAAGTVAVGDEEVRSAVAAVGLITETTEALPRNPNEALLLQSLFARLAALAA